jgi:transposase
MLDRATRFCKFAAGKTEEITRMGGIVTLSALREGFRNAPAISTAKKYLKLGTPSGTGNKRTPLIYKRARPGPYLSDVNIEDRRRWFETIKEKIGSRRIAWIDVAGFEIRKEERHLQNDKQPAGYVPIGTDIPCTRGRRGLGNGTESQKYAICSTAEEGFEILHDCRRTVKKDGTLGRGTTWDSVESTKTLERFAAKYRHTLLLLDNDPVWRSHATARAISRLQIPVIFLPPYSPDAMVIDYVLSSVLRREIKTKLFQSRADLSAALVDCLGSLSHLCPTNAQYVSHIKKLKPHTMGHR